MPPRRAPLALLIAAAAPVNAAEPMTAPCAAPADLGATPLAAWTLPENDAVAAVTVGRPVTLALHNGAASRSLRIAEAGRYGVAADTKVWIDVAANAMPLASVEHGHGPACSGIRKIVWFTLSAGIYELALSKAERASVRLLVVRAP
ncbi:hypothetical protein [Sphingopyxis sp.]|jgi:hypothetical protein|uniref:hypothetical protein n=1 Tax=Sphingopyxis sp. TaxID=1908224 RepID=UPI003F6E6C99